MMAEMYVLSLKALSAIGTLISSFARRDVKPIDDVDDDDDDSDDNDEIVFDEDN